MLTLFNYLCIKINNMKNQTKELNYVTRKNEFIGYPLLDKFIKDKIDILGMILTMLDCFDDDIDIDLEELQKKLSLSVKYAIDKDYDKSNEGGLPAIFVAIVLNFDGEEYIFQQNIIALKYYNGDKNSFMEKIEHFVPSKYTVEQVREVADIFYDIIQTEGAKVTQENPDKNQLIWNIAEYVFKAEEEMLMGYLRSAINSQLESVVKFDPKVNKGIKEKLLSLQLD